MRRFLLSCAVLMVLAVPAVAAARASASAHGYVVVRNAFSDGGVNGKPAVILVVTRGGFVLGRASQEAEVEVYHLGSATNQLAVQVKGDVSSASAEWHKLQGRKYIGSNFRFRITGRFYRVVVRGSGLYVFAGGRGTVKLRGSSVNRRTDGEYSVDGRRFRSMPTNVLTREIGRS